MNKRKIIVIICNSTAKNLKLITIYFHSKFKKSNNAVFTYFLQVPKTQ